MRDLFFSSLTSCRTCCFVLVAGCTQHGIPARQCHAVLARRTPNSMTGFDILPWPAKSLDLNPIEHLWDLIGRDVNQGPLEQTVEDLRTAVDGAWQRLPHVTINGLIQGCPTRGPGAACGPP
ncbi:hypothetical protein TNCV_1255391 [Trichonephila clavipes]|nr:hypothetical protein TNCV_1255391 [Trichonephila clavipes]